MPVDRLKKKKDGTLAYKDECQGVGLRGGACDGDVVWTFKHAESFGQPFTTHAFMCSYHSSLLGFRKVEE